MPSKRAGHPPRGPEEGTGRGGDLAQKAASRTKPVTHGSSEKWRRGRFLVSTDKARLDLRLIHGFLTGSYWARGIPKPVVARSLENSLCFGLYEGGKQVGFSRVISDYATYAYIGDVFVVDGARGRGLGKWLMECVMKHPRLRGLRRWSLVTRDAHGLYAQFGFGPLKSPDRHMEIHNSGVYSKSQPAARKTQS